MSTAIKAISRERSFVHDAEKLLLGNGEVFHGEVILAVTKALLQSGVSYVGGYPGAPVSHLMDVLADARDTVLEPYGIYFEQSASEAGAAALLATSINYPLRGAVTWKSIVGTNVASDALSNVASCGVVGGAVVLVGEDYGEGASVIQERTHAMAMKSSMPLIDPRYDMQKIVDLTELAFEMSEVGHLPVFMSLRIRACHMTGNFVCKANRPSAVKTRNAPLVADPDKRSIPLPPTSYTDERAKIEERLPAVRRFIREHGMNEHLAGAGHRFGVILQGGTYGVVMRALARLGLADGFGGCDVPLLVLNVIHPLVPEEITDFLAGKDSVLIVEEGHPAFIENQVRAFAQEAGVTCRVHGKDMIPTTGEYIAPVVRAGLAAYLAAAAPKAIAAPALARNGAIVGQARAARTKAAAEPLPPRPPSFCTGCPERPIFTAMKLIMRERGHLHISLDIGCSTFASLAPLNIGNTVVGYGLSLASGGPIAAAFDQPTIAVMGDGAFWHNGLTSGAVNAQWQGMDAVLIILENGYASATGQQHVPSTGASPVGRPAQVSIEKALRGIGVSWIRRVDSYSLAETMAGLRAALDQRGPQLRVVISDNECMLAKKRRERMIAPKAGTPKRRERYGVDAEVCTGDHSCIRLNGCPSLTLKPTQDPLKDGPTAYVDNSCAACNLCGEVAQVAQLCPSFYKAEGLVNPSPVRRLTARLNDRLLAWMGAS